MNDHRALEIPMARRKGVSGEVPNRVAARDYQVFVSHATADQWTARTICEKLESVGASTFRDGRDIDGGDDIPDVIRRQIKRSRDFVVLLTPKSLGRPWVTLEIGAAWCWSKSLRIVAILYHVDADLLPEMLKSKKAIPLNDLDEFLAEVKKRVEAHSR